MHFRPEVVYFDIRVLGSRYKYCRNILFRFIKLTLYEYYTNDLGKYYFILFVTLKQFSMPQ